MTQPLSIMLVMLMVGLIPFFAVMVTSYIKLVVVLSLIRNALGVQNIPPNMVINGLAIILSLYIMAPVITQSYDLMKNDLDKNIKPSQLLDVLSKGKEPLVKFLDKNTYPEEKMFFVRSAKNLWPGSSALEDPYKNDLLILIPAFTVSEITEAFKIGFFLYLPFLVIDFIVANVLLAMGMMMVSPQTISLPIKLLLFVVLSGWAKIIHGLVLTYM